MEQPHINVGIMAEPVVSFALNGGFILTPDNAGIALSGLSQPMKASVAGNLITLILPDNRQLHGAWFLFSPTSPNSAFVLHDVTIGITFHWERKERQRFRGALRLTVENGKVRVINIIALEEYLEAVISSEMSDSCSPELLKAHAVISRSWLLAQIEKSKARKARQADTIEAMGKVYGNRVSDTASAIPAAMKQDACKSDMVLPKSNGATEAAKSEESPATDDELIRWYDREDHDTFDVCADDHCQRYQGVTRMTGGKAAEAVQATFGEALMWNDEICDTRFSKCCGGMTESFENVWEPEVHPYLAAVRDCQEAATPYLQREDEATEWIRNNPPAFCNTSDPLILSQVLPDFDRDTIDFYRWRKEYTQQQLASLLQKKTGIDFGGIISLEVLERGYSGRIIKLRIRGTRKTVVIGKELEIRRALSESHLYSAAFTIDHCHVKDGIPQLFVIAGAGWGHGVGLCQIGAAVMGEQGYSYIRILDHYFANSRLQKLYETKHEFCD